MKIFEKQFEVKWSDLDPNRHMRHTAYNDYAAHMRVKILEEVGLTMSKLEELAIGPILFREETLFHREVGMKDNITITASLIKARKDGSRWSFYHEMFRADGIKAATIIVDGAWLDLKKRKLAIPPSGMAELFLNMPKAENFEWI